MSRHLRKMYEQADDIDRAEGRLAYQRYHEVIRMFADEYSAPFDRTLAAFVALSPNNDYFSNLRSLASVLQEWQKQGSEVNATVSTYNHCRRRAWGYLTGEMRFLDVVKGPKIRAFYHNILDPDCRKHVTVDGHMVCAYRGVDLIMKDATVRRAEYRRIENSCKRLARELDLIPNQLQAIIWFARKRTRHIKYEPQLDMFRDTGDVWRTIITPEEARPY